MATHLGARFRHRHGAKFGVRLEAAVERTEEGPPLPIVVLPRILPVEDDENRGLSPAGARGVTAPGGHQPVDEIGGGAFGRPRSVAEADQV
jgi:hypothetical protein